jgi:hypothetical protein
VVGEVLDLVEVARVEHGKADGTAEPFIQPLRLEHGAVAELVLAGIEEVQQDAMHHENRHGKPGAPALP